MTCILRLVLVRKIQRKLRTLPPARSPNPAPACDALDSIGHTVSAGWTDYLRAKENVATSEPPGRALCTFGKGGGSDRLNIMQKIEARKSGGSCLAVHA